MARSAFANTPSNPSEFWKNVEGKSVVACPKGLLGCVFGVTVTCTGVRFKPMGCMFRLSSGIVENLLSLMDDYISDGVASSQAYI